MEQPQLEERACIYCGSKFKVMRQSGQEWHSKACLRMHDPHNGALKVTPYRRSYKPNGKEKAFEFDSESEDGTEEPEL